MNKCQDLLERIPHRPPFRFVDEIVEVDDSRIVATYYADPESAYFSGHYPGNPIMPGVLISEACFQAGALLMAHHGDGANGSGGMPVLTRIQDARFKQIVKPGDRIRIEVTLDDTVDNAYFMTARVTSADKSVLRVSFCCMLAEEGRGTS